MGWLMLMLMGVYVIYMYLCKYIYTYTCTCTYICVHIFTYTHTHTRTHTHIRIYMYIYTHIIHGGGFLHRVNPREEIQVIYCKNVYIAQVRERGQAAQSALSVSSLPLFPDVCCPRHSESHHDI